MKKFIFLLIILLSGCVKKEVTDIKVENSNVEKLPFHISSIEFSLKSNYANTKFIGFSKDMKKAFLSSNEKII